MDRLRVVILALIDVEDPDQLRWRVLGRNKHVVPCRWGKSS